MEQTKENLPRLGPPRPFQFNLSPTPLYAQVACHLTRLRLEIAAIRITSCHGVLHWAPPRGDNFTSLLSKRSRPFLSKRQKHPFLTLRVATPSGAPRQVPLEVAISTCIPNRFAFDLGAISQTTLLRFEITANMLVCASSFLSFSLLPHL